MNSSLTACSPSQRRPGCKFQKQSPLFLWFWRWLTREQFSLCPSFSATTRVHSLSWGLTLPSPSVFQKTGPWLTLTPPIGCQSRSQAAAWHLKSHLLPKEQKVLGFDQDPRVSDAMGPPWGGGGGWGGECPAGSPAGSPAHTHSEAPTGPSPEPVCGGSRSGRLSCSWPGRRVQGRVLRGCSCPTGCGLSVPLPLCTGGGDRA